jgi:hypothetical protein
MKTPTIGDALKYPFARFKRLFYWLWLLIPIIGWLAFSGYILRIIQDVIKGKHRQVPKFGKFWPNCKLGLLAWIVSIVIAVVMMLIGLLQLVLGLWGMVIYYISVIYISLISPIMIVQLAETENLSKAFNFIRAHKIVFGNFRPYIIMLLKQLVVGIVLLLASIPIITLIFTLPAMSYSKQYLYARFYENVKKKPKY